MKKLIARLRLCIIVIFSFLLPVTIITACKKDSSLDNSTEKISLKSKGKSLLSKNSLDLTSRLEVIKSDFYKRKLDAKFAPKNEEAIIWTPQWDNPKIQTVNDSVSYVFYHLKPQVKKDGKMINVKETGAVSYIMVKNEKEFYEAFFYLPSSLRSKTPSNDTPETFMGKFTGKLLLTNLENKQSFLLDYKDGGVTEAYKKQMLASRKLSAVRGATAYYQEQCTTITLGCSFSASGVGDGCWEEGYRVEYNETCSYPTACGFWTLSGIRTQTVCEMVWFPDPPIDPEPPGGGSPPIDCAGVYFGTAYMSDCGCIGGTTGITECPKTPCDEMIDLKNQTFFNNLITNLRGYTSGNFEGAYAFTLNGTYQYAQGVNGQHFVAMSITTPIDGYMHNHFSGGDPIFSNGDIYLISVLYANNKINDINTFTIGVTTAQGTEYFLRVDDVSQFNAFMTNTVGNSTQFTNWSNSYYDTANEYITQNGLSEINAFERAFLEHVDGKGLQVFKKDSSGNYNPIKSSGGSITPDPCN